MIELVGHAGHGNAKQNNDKLFTLEDQIEHKAKFLKTFPKETRFILMGHSIGSFMILKVCYLI